MGDALNVSEPTRNVSLMTVAPNARLTQPEPPARHATPTNASQLSTLARVTRGRQRCLLLRPTLKLPPTCAALMAVELTGGKVGLRRLPTAQRLAATATMALTRSLLPRPK